MATKLVFTHSVASHTVKGGYQKLVVIGESNQLSSAEFNETGLDALVSGLDDSKELLAQLAHLKTCLKFVDKDNLHHI
ncbi:hypothetical protein L0F63_005143, partial [Massospora cicadina]